MWKLILGFAVFAMLAIWVLLQGGDSLDMSGEKHGIEAPAGAASSGGKP